jgi:repressor LexA
VREVQETFGFKAVQTAREHLEALVAQGRLEKRTGLARGYRLVGTDAIPTVLVPILGRVQAGNLSTAIEDLEGFVPVESAGGEELFALQVRGDSMSGAGILDGDTVIVRRQEFASQGEIVVALVEDEATVKRFRIRRGRAELHPENPAFEPIIPPRGKMKLLGKVIELRRIVGKPPFRKIRR